MPTTANYGWTKPASTDAADYPTAAGASLDQIDATLAAQVAALNASAVSLFARRTVDSSPVNNSTSFVNDTSLVIPVAANKVYEMSCAIRYSTNTTADLKIAWQVPSGTTMRYDCLVIPAAGGAWNAFALTESSPLAVDGSGAVMRLTGLVIVAGTAGNLQFQWSQQTANASNTIVQAGSYIRLAPVG